MPGRNYNDCPGLHMVVCVTQFGRLLVNRVRMGSTKLTVREGWRIRFGDYRVVYEIEDERRSVTVLHIGHRRDVYR